MTYFHLGELVFKQAQKYKNRTALKYQDATGACGICHGTCLPRR